MWAKFLTRDMLERARRVANARRANPSGYERLAAFVRAPSLGLDDVLRACEHHRRALEPQTKPESLGWRQ